MTFAAINDIIPICRIYFETKGDATVKKYRFAAAFLAALMSLSLIGCEIKDGVIVIDLEQLGQSEIESNKNDEKDTERDDFGDDYGDDVSDTADRSDESISDSEADSESGCAHGDLDEVVVSEPTCTDSGLSVSICVECGEELASLELEPLGHVTDEWYVGKEPTPAEEGIRFAFCHVCGEKINESIEALGYSEGLVFKTNGDGTCSLSSYGTCSDKIIYVPPTSSKGDKVIAIAENAFKGCDVEQVVLPDTVETIESYAFNDCIYLKNVYLPEGLKAIGYWAFGYCESLAEIDIPASVEKIDQSAFYSAAIRKITVAEESLSLRVENNCLVDSKGVLIVGYGNCSIPYGVKTIGNYAFHNNTDMTSVTIPSGVEMIGEGAFMGSSVKEVAIPHGVYDIGFMAFAGCEQLESVIIPSSVTRIGEDVFHWCDKLSDVKYYGTQEDWNSIDIDEANEVLFAIDISFIEGVTPETVYGYGRTTISGNPARIYDILEECVLAEMPVDYVDLDADDKITIDDFYVARNIFMSDHPECFWWSGVINYSYTSEGYIVSFSFSYTADGEDLAVKRALLEAEVEEILSGLPEGNIFDKMLYLHDAVAERVVYEFTPYDQNPYGALVEGKAVCNGYATAYQMLLQRAGIRAWTVNGSAGGEAHAWNVVWIDNDTCVYTDVTWNDNEQFISHYYFNMSYEEINDDHFTNADFDLPECGHSKYGYYTLSPDAKVLSQSDSAAKLCSFLEEGDNGELSAIFLFNGYSFEDWFAANNTKLSAELGAFKAEYYNNGYEVLVIFKK